MKLSQGRDLQGAPMSPETQDRKPARPLFRLIITVAILLTLMHIGMFAVWRPAPVIVPLPWLIPMLNAVMIVIASGVSFLALGRYRVLRDPVSYWTGMGFAAFSAGFVFYLLAWPGLLPGGEPVIGHFPSTATWVVLPVMSILAVCLLAAGLWDWPDDAALAGPRWLWSLVAWLCFIILGGVLTIVFEKSLPVLVENTGAFTPLALAWCGGVLLLYALGALLSARHYLRTGDTLPGYVSFTQMFAAFALLMAAAGRNRYGLSFFLDRFVVIGGFLIMKFGLLSEYVRLLKVELEKTQALERAAATLQQSQEELQRVNTELERRVLARTRHLEEQRTELKTRNLELHEAYRQLQEKAEETIHALEEVQERDRLLIQQNRMAAMGELIVNIAHEWRQPLNILALIVQEQAALYSQGSVNREDFTATSKKAMEVIGNMSRTIDHFGSFFRPDEERVSFRVSGVLTKVIAMIGASLRELRVSIEVTDQEDLDIWGYQNEFSQVIVNIMLNARDAFRERSVVEPRIFIRMSREAERGVVTIADNAGGIPEAIIDRIFDPYFTTKGPDKGAGLGLYMAKTLIERHMGGQLTVRNADAGAEFRIEV